MNRRQRLLGELIPGQRKRDLSAVQARAMLATVRPRDIAGKTRRRMACEELADLVVVDAKLKKKYIGRDDGIQSWSGGCPGPPEGFLRRGNARGGNV